MTKRILLWAAVSPLFICGLLPIIFMLVSSTVADGEFTFSAYSELLGSTRQWLLLENSLILAGIVAFSVTIIGVSFGILIGKSDLPLKKWLLFILCIPILIPPYIVAVAWDQLLAPGQGPLLLFPQPWHEKVHRLLFGLAGSVFVLSTVYLPIPLLLTSFFVRTVNPRFEEAARLNAAWPRVIRQITLPLIWPGILLASMLVFVLTIGQLSVPSYLRFQVFSVESFTRFSALYDFKGATANSIPLAVMVLPLLFLEVCLAKKWNLFTSGMVQARGLLQIRLGKWKTPAFTLVFVFAFIFVVLPLGYLVINSCQKGVYLRAIEMAGEPLKRSFFYSAVAASILSICGFMAAYAIKNQAICCWRLVNMAGLFLFALPGTVLGIGLIGLWNTKWTHFVYGSMSIVIMGYVAKYYILSVKVIEGRFLQIPSSMEEAAQLAGASWLRRMISVLFPLSRRWVFASWLCVFIFCLRDTDITMLVYPPGCDTLPVRIFTTMANGSPQLVAAMCVLMVLSVVVPAAFVWITLMASGRWENV